jgi:hypothetical protein
MLPRTCYTIFLRFPFQKNYQRQSKNMLSMLGPFVEHALHQQYTRTHQREESSNHYVSLSTAPQHQTSTILSPNYDSSRTLRRVQLKHFNLLNLLLNQGQSLCFRNVVSVPPHSTASKFSSCASLICPFPFGTTFDTASNCSSRASLEWPFPFDTNLNTVSGSATLRSTASRAELTICPSPPEQ